MRQERIFALVDCNNFFCSCERVFRPDLRNKPVVVLSNNDGCIVARSQEVKDLGVPMAAPYFKYKEVLTKNKVRVFSSNYQLYGDISNRVMSLLKEFSDEIEFYSIDEAFLRLDNIVSINYEKYAKEIRQKIIKCTDIPVSIGIGKTKTLAKIANDIAKKSNSGVFVMLNDKLKDEVLKQTKVEDIWGVGFKTAQKLKLSSIQSAYQLMVKDTMWMRKYYKVTGEKIVRELNNISCFEIEDFKPKKNIVCSRSFGYLVQDQEILKQILANYAVKACQKMRQQKSRAQGLAVFLKTNKFKTSDQQYKNIMIKGFDFATNDSSKIIKIAFQVLEEIFKKGYNYHKCGIILLDLISQDYEQGNLFANNDQNSKNEKLMKIIDIINHNYGKEAIFLAAQGIKRGWSLKCDHRSPRYTTNWNELYQIQSLDKL